MHLSYTNVVTENIYTWPTDGCRKFRCGGEGMPEAKTFESKL